MDCDLTHQSKTNTQCLKHDFQGKSGEILYSASSPDEAALVYAAKHFGFFFKAKEQGGKFIIEMRNKKNADVVYEILEFLEFNSDRKRSR